VIHSSNLPHNLLYRNRRNKIVIVNNLLHSQILSRINIKQEVRIEIILPILTIAALSSKNFFSSSK
jgi:hypothetical protein